MLNLFDLTDDAVVRLVDLNDERTLRKVTLQESLEAGTRVPFVRKDVEKAIALLDEPFPPYYTNSLKVHQVGEALTSIEEVTTFCSYPSSEAMFKSGAVKTILGLLRAYPSTGALIEKCFGIFLNLAEGPKMNSRALISVGVAEGIVEAMRKNIANYRVQMIGNQLLSKLAEGDDLVKLKLLKAGAAELIYKCFAKHDDSILLSRSGGRVLWHLIAHWVTPRKTDYMYWDGCPIESSFFTTPMKRIGSNPDAILRSLILLARVRKHAGETFFDPTLEIWSILKKGLVANFGRADVQAGACKAISEIAAKGNTNEIISAGFAECILGAMKRHPNDAGVQEQACAAIFRLGGTKTSAHSATFRSLGAEELVEQACCKHQAIASFKNVADKARATLGMKKMSSISTIVVEPNNGAKRKEEQKKPETWFDEESSRDIRIRKLRQAIQNGTKQETAVDVVTDICNPDAIALLIGSRVPMSLSRLVSSCPKSDVLLGLTCEILLNMIEGSKENAVKLVRLGLDIDVVRFLKKNIGVYNLQRLGLELLVLFSDADEKSRTNLMAFGAVEVALKALKRHSESLLINKSVGKLLWNLVAHGVSPTNEEKLILEGTKEISKLYFTPLGKIGTDPENVRMACKMLTSVCKACGECDLSTQGQLLSCIKSALKALPENEYLQMHACEAIYVLAGKNQGDVLMKEGFGECVLEAMKRHPTEKGLQESACGALWKLAKSKKNKHSEKLRSLGAVELVEEALRDLKRSQKSLIPLANKAFMALGAQEKQILELPPTPNNSNNSDSEEDYTIPLKRTISTHELCPPGDFNGRKRVCAPPGNLLS